MRSAKCIKNQIYQLGVEKHHAWFLATVTFISADQFAQKQPADCAEKYVCIRISPLSQKIGTDLKQKFNSNQNHSNMKCLPFLNSPQISIWKLLLQIWNLKERKFQEHVHSLIFLPQTKSPTKPYIPFCQFLSHSHANRLKKARFAEYNLGQRELNHSSMYLNMKERLIEVCMMIIVFVLVKWVWNRILKPNSSKGTMNYFGGTV